MKDRIPVGKKKIKNNHLAVDRPDPHAAEWFKRAAYPCKAAELIREQGKQMREVDAVDYLAEKYNISAEHVPGGDTDGQSEA